MTGLYFILFGTKSRRKLTTIVPKSGDFKDSVAKYLYNLGIIDKPIRFNRFSYMNKFKHMAFILLGIIMSVTGVIMWTEYRWSKFTIDVAKIVHSMQAILMCLVIALNLIGRSLKE
jgi:cytochrome b subunit of formate dehydrogenase